MCPSLFMYCNYGKNKERRQRRVVLNFLTIYYVTNRKLKNMLILFEKLYRTHTGGIIQMCFIQFSNRICIFLHTSIYVKIKLNKIYFYDLNILFVYSN